MSYAQKKELSGNKTLSIIMVVLLQFALGYAIITGLAYNVIKKATEDLKTFDVEEQPPPPEEPPPPPKDMPKVPPPPTTPPPLVRMQAPTPPIELKVTKFGEKAAASASRREVSSPARKSPFTSRILAPPSTMTLSTPSMAKAGVVTRVVSQKTTPVINVRIPPVYPPIMGN